MFPLLKILATSLLFVLKIRGWLSVVPKKLEDVVPAFPVRFHPLPPPAGAAHVPSLLKKSVVLLVPGAGTNPFSVVVKVFSSAVNCVAVRSVALAVAAVLLPLNVCAAICASIGFVTLLAPMEVATLPDAVVTSPVKAGCEAAFNTPVILAAVPVVFWFNVGISAATIVLNTGAPADPFNPAKNVLADCDVNVNDKAGVVVGVPTDVVNKGDKLPDVKLVTVPLPPAGVKYSKAVPPAFTRNCWLAVPNAVRPVPPFATGKRLVQVTVPLASVLVINLPAAGVPVVTIKPVDLIVPVTSNFCAGAVLPMPILPNVAAAPLI